MSERLFPQDIEAERMVLSAIFHQPHQGIERCVERGVTVEWFHSPAHATVWESMRQLDQQGMVIELVTLTDWLRTNGRLEQVGGAATVTEICIAADSAAHISYHLDIVEKMAVRRQIIQQCTQAIESAYSEQDEPAEILDGVEARILEIRDRRSKSNEQTMLESVKEGLALIQRSVELKGQPSGWRTPFDRLDLMTDGLHGGEVTALAGAPSVGKTALGMQIMEYLASCNVPSGVLSLEMSGGRLMQRSILSRSGISMQRIRMGLSEHDYGKINATAQRLLQLPLKLDTAEGTSILALRAKLRRWKRNYGTRVAMIDNLSLMRGDSKRAKENRRLEVEEITNGLKSISKELDMHIIALVHIGREAVKAGRRPRMQDMKESGSIEQDADCVWLLHRPEAGEDDQGDAVLSDNGEIIAAKTRSGSTGCVPVRFIKELTRFVDREMP